VIYEWDPKKAKANLRKHGVSFEDAASVFLDPQALTYPDPDHSGEEIREITIGHSAKRGSSLSFTHATRRSHSNHQRTQSNTTGAQTI
jgi:uncharacterized DUF497 family protein